MKPLREIAYKLWIANIVQSPYVNNDAETPRNYVQYNGFKVARVNLIANVVDTFMDENKQFASITVDDGSSTIRVRAFKEDLMLFENVQKGDLVMVIGRVREYNEEVYVLPEIVKKVDDLNWEWARKLELVNTVKEYTPQQQVPVEQSTSEKKPKFKVLAIVKEEGDEGLGVDAICEHSLYSAEETKKLIQELVNEGEVYEHKPGHYKAI